jgi:hypothetical protein
MTRTYNWIGLIIISIAGITWFALPVRSPGRGADAPMVPKVRASREVGATPSAANVTELPSNGPPVTVTNPERPKQPEALTTEPSIKPQSDPADTRARFDYLFEKEPADVATVRNRLRTLKGRLNSILASDSSLKSIECRSKMCRIETVHQNEDGFRAYMDGAFRNIDTKLTTGASYTSGKESDRPGEVVLVTYLAADGENLPDVTTM